MAIRKRGDVGYVDFRITNPVTGRTKRYKRSAGRHATKKGAQALERQWRRQIQQASLESPRQEEPEPKKPKRRRHRRRDEAADMAPRLSEVRVNSGKPPPTYISSPTGGDTFGPTVGLGGIRCRQGVVKELLVSSANCIDGIGSYPCSLGIKMSSMATSKRCAIRKAKGRLGSYLSLIHI